MSFSVFMAALFSAFMHAVWNVYAKKSSDKLSHFTVMSVTYTGLGAAVALSSPFIFLDHAPLLILAALFHVLYRFLLSLNYEDGDLNFVYPLCRGFAPFVVIVLSLLVIREFPSRTELAGIILISACIIGFGLNKSHHSWKTYFIALGTGLCIAAYSFLGGLAARQIGNALLSVSYIAIIDGPLFVLTAYIRQPQRLKDNITGNLHVAAAGGIISFFGYAIAMWCMKHADMSAVTALRATSVMFAAVLAAVILKEKTAPLRGILIFFICMGIILIKL
jgi:drug/metabolite transporter (DMT)-like permease